MRRKSCNAVFVFVLCVCTGVASAAEEAERLTLLEEWSEQPLDIRNVSAEQLALLPGIDPHVAASIIGLRALGRLERPEDLGRVPGLDASSLGPWVSFPPPRGPRWRVEMAAESSSEVALRERIHAEATWVRCNVRIVAERRDGGLARARGAFTLERDGWRCAVGALRERGGGWLLRSDPRVRSRTAPSSRPGMTVWVPRTDLGAEPGWRGASFETRGADLTLAGCAGVDPRGRATRRLALRHRTSGFEVAGLAEHSREPGWSVWLRRRGEGAEVWTEVAGSAAAIRASWSARWVGESWRVAWDETSARDFDGRGLDPATGQVLDRAHRSRQTTVDLRLDGARVRLLWRTIDRADVGTSHRSDRLRVSLVRSGRDRRGRSRFEFGWDESDGGEAEPLLSWTHTREVTVGRATVGVSRRGEHGEGSTLVRATWSDRSEWRVSVGLASVAGESARAWGVRRPPRSGLRWLHPGDLGVNAAVRWGVVGAQLVAWADAAVGSGETRRWKAGIGMRRGV